MSFVYHHRPTFKGTLRIHNSDGVFAFHEYVLEAKDTWQESDGDISFSMVKNNATKTLQDYADELGFNVISGDPLSYNNGGHNRGGTLAAYQIHCDSGVEVEDLSSLENIQLRSGLQATIPSDFTPVVVSTYQNQKIYEVNEKIQVRFNGTVNHDPDREVLILKDDRNAYNRYPNMGSSSWYGTTLGIAGIYNYGVETTVGDRVSYSSASGLHIIGNARLGTWNPRDAGMTGSGTWRCRGGVVVTNKMLNYNGTIDVKGTTIVGTPSGGNLEWRNPFGNSNSSFEGFFSGFNIIKPTSFPAVLGFKKATIGEVISGATTNGQPNVNAVYTGTLRNFDMSQNTDDYDIGHDGQNGQGHAEWFVVNSETGTDIKTMWRDTRGNTGQRGVVLIQKEVSFNISDSSGNAIEGVQLYLKDNPSAYAKDAVFSADKFNVDYIHTYPDTRTEARGELDADGNLIYKYADPITYTKSSDANGEIGTFLVTTGTQIHEFNVNDEDAVAVYGMHFSNDRWRISESDNTTPSYYHWDTDEFGGFYKVDRRGNDNTNADLFTFNFISYGYGVASTTQALRGIDELSINWVLFEDNTITEPNKDIVDEYTQIETSAKFYDRAKAYLTDFYAGESTTIVARSGNEINLGSYDLVIDANVEEAFAFDGTTITIKASTFVGDLVTSGSITLNNATVSGRYTDSTGENLQLPWVVSNVEATSSLQLWNMTKNAEVIAQVVPGEAGEKVSAGGTYTAQQISSGDNIRLRITCQAGVEALLPYESYSVANDSGLSFIADQKPDLVYNANGIDGSLVSTLTADYPNVQIDISDGDGVADTRELYAFAVYQSTTFQGIDKWFNAITPIDAMNYRINTANADIKLQNTGSVPLTIAGARIFRDDGTSVLFAEAGDQPMVQDTGELVQYIAPQIDTAMNQNVKLHSVHTNSELIPAVALSVDGVSKNSSLIPSLL